MNTMMQDALIHRPQASPVAAPPANPSSASRNSPGIPSEISHGNGSEKIQTPAVSQGRAAGVQLDRQQILEATRTCLDGQGYDATTIRRIAAQLDCAIGSIYRYYRDKHELLSCVTGQPFEQLADDIEQGLPFAQSVQAYVQLASDSLQSYSLMFWLANQKLDGQDGSAASSAVPANSQLPQAIGRIIAGWADELGETEQARVRWSIMHGSIMAGLDAPAVLASLGLAQSHSRKADPQNTDVSDDAHDRTRVQIMTVMRNPPLPRALREKNAAVPQVREDAPQPKEDVCLL